MSYEVSREIRPSVTSVIRKSLSGWSFCLWNAWEKVMSFKKTIFGACIRDDSFRLLVLKFLFLYGFQRTTFTAWKQKLLIKQQSVSWLNLAVCKSQQLHPSNRKQVYAHALLLLSPFECVFQILNLNMSAVETYSDVSPANLISSNPHVCRLLMVSNHAIAAVFNDALFWNCW